MAYALTYNNLLSLIPAYLERTDQDVIDNIPVFVLLAQKEITKDSKTLGLQFYIQGAFSTGVSTIQKPVSWRETLSFNYGSGTSFSVSKNIELRTYEFCRSYWPDPDQIGEPKYYADYGYNNWLIVPTPDQIYPFEVSYYGETPTLDSENQTNWVTQFAPELLIYNSLMQAQIYLKNDEREAYFKNVYQAALASLLKENKERLTDRAQEAAK